MRLWGKEHNFDTNLKKVLNKYIGNVLKEVGFSTLTEYSIEGSNPIDVVVWDESKQDIAFIEVKWPIEVDTLKEAENADDLIKKGFDQLELLKQYVETSPEKVAKDILKDVTSFKSHYLVACQGFLGNRSIQRSDMPVVSVDYLIQQCKNFPNLKHLIANLKSMFNVPIISPEFDYVELHLAGYVLNIPATLSQELNKWNDEEHNRFSKADRNVACPCASGIKFKKCCRE